MQIFNVGIGELLFILALAFIVLGPKGGCDRQENRCVAQKPGHFTPVA